MKESLQDALAPVVEFLETLDPGDSTAAEALNAHFPVDGPLMSEIAGLFEAGVKQGWLCDRQGPPEVTYSRVAKAVGAKNMSIDAVRMGGPGVAHTHPEGEFDLTFASEGEPLFDGHPPGWTVYPPKSWHVPTVTGGVMNTLYFLPGGAIVFGPKSE